MNTHTFNFNHRSQEEGPDRKKRRVFFLLLPEVNLLDLAGPAQVFHTANVLNTDMSYELNFCGLQPEVVSAPGLALNQLKPLVPATSSDFIVVPGLDLRRYAHDAMSAHLDPMLACWLNDAYKAGTHIASVCTGAFVLGEAGLLNERRCTTHWEALGPLRQRYPQARVEDKVLFVHDQRITTSAGIASGIDMALSLLEQEHGPVLAAHVAHFLVIYLRRNGLAAQTSVFLEYRTHLHPAIHRVQDYLMTHINETVPMSKLADIAQMSLRSLNRVFKQTTGITPLHYHQRLRLELATNYLTDQKLSIETIAGKCGFQDVRHFRRVWRQQFGTAPSTSRILERNKQ